MMKVCFLDKDYTFPTDVLTYVEEHNYFESLRQKLLTEMLSNFSDWEKFPKDLEKVALQKFKGIAQLCITKLCHNNIYSYTVDDYMNDNPGINIFLEEVKKYLVENALALQEKMLGVMNGVERAERVAESQVIGTGLEIWTNSLIGAGVWAFMEQRELKKQCAEADKQYQAILNEAIQQSEDSEKNRVQKYRANVWLPKLEESVKVFIAHIFDKYIQDLITHNKFQSDALNYHDVNRAEAILQNLESAADKKRLLQEAFVTCPYCLALYLRCCELGFLDNNMVNTIKRFDLQETLQEVYRRMCNDIIKPISIEEDAIKQIAPYIKTLATLGETSEELELEKCLSKRRKEVLWKLEKLGKIDTQEIQFDKIMRTIISPNVIEMVEGYQKGLCLDQLVEEYIDSNILQSNRSSFYDECKVETIKQVMIKAEEYLEEAIRRYCYYQSCIEEETSIKDKIDLYCTQLNELGVLSFGKKHEIKQNIKSYKNALNECEEKTKIAFYKLDRMYQQQNL